MYPNYCLNYDQVELLQEAISAAILAETKAIHERLIADKNTTPSVVWMKQLQDVRQILEMMLKQAEAKFPGNEPIVYAGEWHETDKWGEIIN